MTLIGAARLFLKEKSGQQSKSRNIDPIITKLGTHIGLIKLQIEFGDELCGANRRGRKTWETG